MDIINTMISMNDDSKIVIGKDKTVNVLYDEEGNNISKLYIPNINHFLQNPKLATRKILEWWEIRSWTHIHDPTFLNEEESDWGHDTGEPLLGFGKCDNNKVFDWGKSVKHKWKDGLIFNSFYYPQNEYTLLKILHNKTSSGVIVDHITDTSKTLYLSFREMTSPSEVGQWFTGIFRLMNVSKCPYTSNLPENMNVNKGIWDHSYTDYRGEGNIRQQLLDFINDGFDINSYDEIVLIGMSLGACIAQCVCLDLIWRIDDNKITMILFGSPRVYTPSVVNYLNSRGVICLRIDIDSFDDPSGFPCPHTSFFIQWKHLGIPIRMNSVVHTQIDEVDQNNCIYYISKEKKCNKIPYKPLALLQGTYNLHSRLPYSLHIYYAARKFDKLITSVI